MRLIPYEKLVLNTMHSSGELRRRLETGIGTPRKGWRAAMAPAEKPFEGTFDGSHFKFWSAIRHNNGFMAIGYGTIESGKLTVELKWHPFTRIFLPVWLAFFLTIMWLVKDGCPDTVGPWREGRAFTACLVGVIVVMALGWYNFYAYKAKKFLLDVAGTKPAAQLNKKST